MVRASLLAVLTRYIPGKNVLADQVSLPDKGPSHRMVSSSPGIRLHLQGLWLPSHRLVCYKSKHKVTSTHVSASKFHNMETRCLEHLLDNLSAYAFTPLLFSAGFVENNAFNRALIGSHNSILASEGEVADLLALLMKESLELLLLWKMLVESHVRKILLGLEMLCLHP